MGNALNLIVELAARATFETTPITARTSGNNKGFAGTGEAVL